MRHDTPPEVAVAAPEQLSSELHELLTVDDVAALLRVSKSWVYEHTRARVILHAERLPHVRIGKCVRFDSRAVRAYLAGTAASHLAHVPAHLCLVGPRSRHAGQNHRAADGPAKVDTTLNIYAQVLDGSVREAAERVGRRLITIDHSAPEVAHVTHYEGWLLGLDSNQQPSG